MTVLREGVFRIPGANPLRALYRVFDPIPKSPAPNSADDAYALQLVPTAQLTQKFVVAIDFLTRSTGTLLGDYVEFGVYNGTSMGCMFDALTQQKQNHVRLTGFDSFEGLPSDVTNEDGGVWQPGQFACPKNVTLMNLAQKGIPRARIQLIEGWYKETLRAKPSDFGLNGVSLVMIDCDAYSSAKLALKFIRPALNDLCVIFFDDWRLNNLDIRGMGEYRAFEEFLKSYPEFDARSWGRYNRKSKIFVLRRQHTLARNPLRKFAARILQRW
jgi:O-methyltransferase